MRRSKAVGILAQPALALALLQRHAAVDPDEPLPEEPDCPTCGGSLDPAPFPVDPDKLRPQATLYVRISEEALRAGTGVAVCGGTGGAGSVGVVTVQQVARPARALPGHRPPGPRPARPAARSTPTRSRPLMREALKLSPAVERVPLLGTDAEPDLDHTIPYVPPDDGGPPGQTRIENLGPLTRFTTGSRPTAAAGDTTNPSRASTSGGPRTATGSASTSTAPDPSRSWQQHSSQRVHTNEPSRGSSQLLEPTLASSPRDGAADERDRADHRQGLAHWSDPRVGSLGACDVGARTSVGRPGAVRPEGTSSTEQALVSN